MLDSTVQPVAAPDELAYNYWFLKRCFIHPERLKDQDLFASQGDSLAQAGLTGPTDLTGINDNEYLSLQALYQSLQDPYTRYVAPQKAASQQQHDTSSAYSGGIGVEYAWAPGPDSIRLEIFRVYPDGPADSAGLRKGDRLLMSNGVNLQTDSAYVFIRRLLQDSLWIRLQVLRASDTLAIDIKRGMVYAPTVFNDTLDGVPVLLIRQFVRSSIRDGGTNLEFHRALMATQSAHARVLDLRGNPGGEVQVCLAMADEFIDHGPMIHLIEHSFDGRGRAVVDTTTPQSTTGGAGVGSYAVLLVDSLTASCAEIFAVALHDNLGDQAVLVGNHTYGKGIGQSHWKTPAGGMSIVTSLQIRSPQWLDYQGIGVAPDIATTPENALSAAITLVQAQNSLPRRIQTSTTAQFPRILREVDAPSGPTGGAWQYLPEITP